MASYRAAVIGLGRIASTIDEEIQKYDPSQLPYAHIACHTEVPEIELVGMSDTWEEQRAAAGRKWKFDALFDDYRQMLTETKPDIVSLCTSAKPRAEIILEIAAGDYGVKAIWAEKPITLSLDEADRVIEACRGAGIVLAVNTSRRWHDVYRQALAMVDDGLIGDRLHVQAMAQCNTSHNGSHILTTLTMFAGARAEWVIGEVESDDAAASENDFQSAAYIAFTNGVRGYFRGMPNGPNDGAYDVMGTTGMIRIMSDAKAVEHWTLEPPLEGQRRDAPSRRFFPPPRRRRSAGVNVVYDLMHCIETGDAPKSGGEDAREALEIAIAIRESHRRGNVRIDLPLEDRSLRIISGEVVRSELPRAILRQREAEAARS